VANKIKNRFAALVRCLDLEGSPGPFQLTDAVIPVVPVSSCLERIAFGSRLAASAGITSVSGVTQVAGVYRITVTLSALTAAASARASYVIITVGPTNAQLIELCTWLHGSVVGNENEQISFELNLPDQWRLYLEANATGVGNTEVLNGVIQPL